MTFFIQFIVKISSRLAKMDFQKNSKKDSIFYLLRYKILLLVLRGKGDAQSIKVIYKHVYTMLLTYLIQILKTKLSQSSDLLSCGWAIEYSLQTEQIFGTDAGSQF